MEGAATTIELTTLVALGSLILALIGLLIGVMYRLGKHSSRFDHIDSQFERLLDENTHMREENRRNHQQLLQALAHHTHDSDTGFAIFRIPPGTENPAV